MIFSNDNRNNNIKKYIATIYVKKKEYKILKEAGGKLLTKAIAKLLASKVGLVVAAFILCMILILSVIQGFTAEQTLDDTLSSEKNQQIYEYLDKKVEETNQYYTYLGTKRLGKMCDYYGTDIQFKLKNEYILAYIKYVEMLTNIDTSIAFSEENKDSNFLDGIIDTFKSAWQIFKVSTYKEPSIEDKIKYIKKGIDKYCELLHPEFTYKEDKVITIVDYNALEQVSEDEDVTDPVTGETSVRTKVYTQVVHHHDRSEVNAYFIIKAKNLKGTYDISYETSTEVHSYNSGDSGQSGEGREEVIKPIIKSIDQVDAPYENLKKIILSKNPREDIDMAIDFITNVAENYSKKASDDQWVFENITTIGGTEGSGINVNPTVLLQNIPLFLQWDGRWGNKAYGRSGTIGTSGCGPTSFAMIATGLDAYVSELDLNRDGILDPYEASVYSVSIGGRIDGLGTAWDFFAKAAAATRLKVTQVGPQEYKKILENLQKGNPVIASMSAGHFTKGGHFIVLKGLDSNGKIIVNDPNSIDNSNVSWDINIIVSEAVQFWIYENPEKKGQRFIATAYDLSNESCGKKAGEFGYGITANGTNLGGKNITNSKYVAVDPSIIPLGSKLNIQFPEDKRYININGIVYDMNGDYLAVDTGGAIKGYKIDIYLGEDKEGQSTYSALCSNFGVVVANVINE